ncbi:MAG: MFS transporter [Anaerolineae bacterium]|nr:MFS transporter [Anaerolineae bacterium]
MSISDDKKIMIITSIAFFCLGISLAVIGPVLPQLSRQSGAGLVEIGAVFTMLFLGALIAQVAAGPISDRFGQRTVLFWGSLILGAGMLVFSLSPSLWMILLFAFLGGLGHGAVDLSSNVLIAQVFERRSVAALNLLNFFYGLGAFAGPALVGLAIGAWNNGLYIPAINGLLFIALAPFILKLKIPQNTVVALEKRPNDTFSVYRQPLLWMLGLLLLVYVGVENGLGGWISTYMSTTTRLSMDSAALVSSAFWMALTLGRLLNAYLGMRLSPERILFTCIGTSLAGGLLFAFSTGVQTLSIISILLTGLGFGAVYPTVIAIVNKAFRQNAGKAASLAAAMGSIGGMILPWAQGFILDRYGASASAWFVCLGIAGLLVLFIVIHQLNQPARQSVPACETN